MHKDEIVDADFEEVEEIEDFEDNTQSVEVLNDDTDTPTTGTRMPKLAVAGALKGAVQAGQLTAGRAKQIREEMGIFQSDFTKSKVSDSKRKTKRKAQKSARKKQRK